MSDLLQRDVGEFDMHQLIERLMVLGVDDHGKRAAAYWLRVQRDRIELLERDARRAALDLNAVTAKLAGAEARVRELQEELRLGSHAKEAVSR